MTEAMSRREIEDVLSSIRRLVSQEQPRPEQTAPSTNESAASGKLILTSELRVNEGPSEQDAEIPANLYQQQDERFQAAQDESVLTLQADDTAGPTVTEPKPVADDTSSAIHMLRAMNQRDADKKTATVAAKQDAAAQPDDATVPSDADSDLALEATLARLERVLSQQKTQPHPDRDPASAMTPDIPDTQAPASGPHAGDLTDPQQTAASSDDPVIDEAMLYQIVANIVRQELQGELGERITRNIRKLVRAEVARELQLRKS